MKNILFIFSLLIIPIINLFSQDYIKEKSGNVLVCYITAADSISIYYFVDQNINRERNIWDRIYSSIERKNIEEIRYDTKHAKRLNRIENNIKKGNDLYAKNSILGCKHYFSINVLSFPLNLTYEHFNKNKWTSFEFSLGYKIRWSKTATDNRDVWIYIPPLFYDAVIHKPSLYNSIYARVGIKHYTKGSFYVSPQIQFTYKYYNNSTIIYIPDVDYENPPKGYFLVNSNMFALDLLFQIGGKILNKNSIILEPYAAIGLRFKYYSDQIRLSHITSNYYNTSFPNNPWNTGSDNFIPTCLIGFRLGYASKYK